MLTYVNAVLMRLTWSSLDIYRRRRLLQSVDVVFSISTHFVVCRRPVLGRNRYVNVAHRVETGQQPSSYRRSNVICRTSPYLPVVGGSQHRPVAASAVVVIAVTDALVVVRRD